MKITIDSTDTKFMCRLIDFLNTEKVKKDSTSIKIHADIPEEEASRLSGEPLRDLLGNLGLEDDDITYNDEYFNRYDPYGSKDGYI